jgi:hypothetical protein
MTGYVVDDLALTAGLASTGSEHHRREMSRLLRDAIDGGPAIEIPALCLTAAAAVRPEIVGHLAELIATAPAGTIEIRGLRRTARLDMLRDHHPRLGWPGTHAAFRATTSRPIITLDAGRYRGVPVNALSL